MLALFVEKKREKNQQLSKNLSAAVEYWDVTISVTICIHVWSKWKDNRGFLQNIWKYICPKTSTKNGILWQNNPPISLNHTQGANSHNNKKQHYFLLFDRKRLATQQSTDTNKHWIIYICHYTLLLIFSPSYLPSMLLLYHQCVFFHFF